MLRILGTVIASVLLLAGCGTAPDQAALSSWRTTSTVPSVVVVAVGDIACPPGGAATRTRCRQGATARAALALKPNRVLALGDLQYEKGSYAGFVGSYAKSWGKLLSITWPVVGNHEYQTAGAAGYFRYLKGKTSAPGWYRREINGWQVFVLNSNCTKVDCTAERNWLKGQLIAHPSKCALIAMHHPRFSSGGEHGSTPSMRSFWDLADRYGVDLGLSGHDHDYERFAPMNATGGLDQNAPRQFVSGTGGKSLYPKGPVVPGSQRFINTTFGVLKLTLRPAGYSWQYRDTALKVRDSGSSVCR